MVEVIAAAGRVPESAVWRTLSHTTRPDVVLLTGGTDGGNTQVIVDAAQGIVAGGWTGPVVVAGNVDARDEVTAALAAARRTSSPTTWCPASACWRPSRRAAAIREMFLSHVIGGKHLSKRADFTAMVTGATPDVVLTGVELLARGLDADHPGAGDVVVVDVGGATTDVHSVVELDPEEATLSREVVATTPVTRTVEGDLGMRWSATSTVAEAGLDDLAAARRPPARRPGLPARAPMRSTPTTSASRRPPSAWPCAATPAAARSWSAPTAASSSAPARTSARSTSSSPPAACSGTAGRASSSGCSRAAPARSRAAGSCPCGRGSSSTATTCSPRPGCWPSGIREAAYRLVRTAGRATADRRMA